MLANALPSLVWATSRSGRRSGTDPAFALKASPKINTEQLKPLVDEWLAENIPDNLNLNGKVTF